MNSVLHLSSQPQNVPLGARALLHRRAKSSLSTSLPYSSSTVTHVAQMMKAGSCSAPGAMFPSSSFLAVPRLTVLQPSLLQPLVSLSRADTSKAGLCHPSAQRGFHCYFSSDKNTLHLSIVSQDDLLVPQRITTKNPEQSP